MFEDCFSWEVDLGTTLMKLKGTFLLLHRSDYPNREIYLRALSKGISKVDEELELCSEEASVYPASHAYNPVNFNNMRELEELLTGISSVLKRQLAKDGVNVTFGAQLQITKLATEYDTLTRGLRGLFAYFSNLSGKQSK